ncbi:hypothetical protein [Ferruginibacter profundus]
MLLLFFGIFNTGVGQNTGIDKVKFFTDDELIQVTITADFKKMDKKNMRPDAEPIFFPAAITFFYPDSTVISDNAEVRIRGVFRKEECVTPPLMVNFKSPTAAALKKLGHLKLVRPCDISVYNEQLLLKEYLVYKIYNLLCEKSFRVRLIKLKCCYSSGKNKPISQFAFFIEDVDDMARRNHCYEIKSPKFQTEQTERKQMTLLALFQYMIGNTDWAIPLYRNVKLLRINKDSMSLPFVVPYDFDYCGLVNAAYAIPVPELEIANVKERLYRGFARTMEELRPALQLLQDKRYAIDSLITNFELLSAKNKKEMVSYLSEFYSAIANENNVKHLFIDNARKE